MRGPRIDNIAGSNVRAAITETVGIKSPPIPIERMNGMGRMIMLSKPMPTVEPETMIDRPACSMLWIVASSTPWPLASSSRNRKINSSE